MQCNARKKTTENVHTRNRLNEISEACIYFHLPWPKVSLCANFRVFKLMLSTTVRYKRMNVVLTAFVKRITNFSATIAYQAYV